MDSLFLVGGGGHCHACIDVVEAGNKYKIEHNLVKRIKSKHN